MSDLSARVSFARRMTAADPALRLYAILDAETCRNRGLSKVEVARSWAEAGVCLVQYRDKSGSDDEVLRSTEEISNIFDRRTSFLILNDRVQLLKRCGWDGVHVGQGDMPSKAARDLVGDAAILGVSTHTPDEAEAAAREDVDYVAFGPVYATATKVNAEPVVGLCGLEAARALCRMPLVAIGGIGLSQARAVRSAGADSVALISALLPASVPAGQISDFGAAITLADLARDFLAALQ